MYHKKTHKCYICKTRSIITVNIFLVFSTNSKQMLTFSGITQFEKKILVSLKNLHFSIQEPNIYIIKRIINS